MTSKQIQDFNIEVLLDLESYKKNSKKWASEIQRDKPGVLDIVMGALIQNFNNEHTSPVQKLNSVRICKDIVDSENIQGVQLVEQHCLTFITEVCKFRRESSDENRGSTYFGDNQNKEIQQIGSSLHRLCLELVQYWSEKIPLQENGQPTQFASRFQDLVQLKVLFPVEKKYIKKKGQNNILIKSQISNVSNDANLKNSHQNIQTSTSGNNNNEIYQDHKQLEKNQHATFQEISKQLFEITNNTQIDDFGRTRLQTLEDSFKKFDHESSILLNQLFTSQSNNINESLTNQLLHDMDFGQVFIQNYLKFQLNQLGFQEFVLKLYPEKKNQFNIQQSRSNIQSDILDNKIQINQTQYTQHPNNDRFNKIENFQTNQNNFQNFDNQQSTPTDLKNIQKLDQFDNKQESTKSISKMQPQLITNQFKTEINKEQSQNQPIQTQNLNVEKQQDFGNQMNNNFNSWNDIPVQKQIGILYFNIIQAKNLINHNLIEKLDPFVEIQLLIQEKLYGQKINTAVIKNSINPVWNHQENININTDKLQDVFLTLDIVDKNVSKNQYLGQVKIQLDDIIVKPGTWINKVSYNFDIKKLNFLQNFYKNKNLQIPFFLLYLYDSSKIYIQLNGLFYVILIHSTYFLSPLLFLKFKCIYFFLHFCRCSLD